MPRVTEPLREEHRELLPQLESLREAADALSGATDAALQEKVDRAYAFLAEHLLPHAQAEEAALYPAVAHVMGAEGVTKTMSRDHVEVKALTEELGRLQVSAASADEAAKNELRRLLYGLYTLVKVHFAKEEEVYLPLLDERLSERDAAELFEAMEPAARAAKASHGH